MGDLKILELNLRKLYCEEKKTDSEIAKIFGLHKQKIYRLRKQFGISSIKKWERHDFHLSDIDNEIIMGSLLGDASVSNGKRLGEDCESFIEFKHCKEQEKYIWWKFDKLKHLCASNPKPLKNQQIRFRTFSHPDFTKIRKLLYPSGVKIVHEKQLKAINELGLAVWYMDDGTICNQHHVKLCTCCYSMQDHIMLQKWMFDRFSLKTEIKTYGNYLFLVVSSGYRRKFFTLIEKFVLDCMKYKLRLGENYNV